MVVGVTMLISEEIVAIAGLVALVSVVTLWPFRYRTEVRPRLPFVAKCVGWAAGVAVCICGPALAYQFLGPLVLKQGIHSSLSLDLLSTVRPGSVAAVLHQPAPRRPTGSSRPTGWRTPGTSASS